MRKNLAAKSTLIAVTLTLGFILSTRAMAQPPRPVRIPPGPLVPALQSLAQQMTIQLIYEPSRLNSYRTAGVSGTYTARAAVRLLLKGTPLVVEADTSGAMAIVRAGSTDDPGPGHERMTSGKDTPRTTLAKDGEAGKESTAASTAPENMLEAVVVTARRQKENLQNVPETVEAVTGAMALKYNLVEFSDLSELIPGFSTNDTGYTNGLTLRGVSGETSNIPSTTATYLNETPVQPTFLFMSMYDLQEFEVVRGPQGTVRGQIAETGAVNFSTRRPDLNEMGGYVSVTVGNLNDTNVQGAIGFPIIPGKLAIRFAGTDDRSEGNFVTSLDNPAPPSDDREAGRVSVSFVPTDYFNAFVSYQHAERNDNYYIGPYDGPGNGIDGPPLQAVQEKSVEPGQTHVLMPFNDVEGSFNLTLFGQRLTDDFGYNNVDEEIHQDYDPTNADPGIALPSFSPAHVSQESNDVRIASAKPLFGGHFDYVVGYFYNLLSTTIHSNSGYTFYPGALGNPSIVPPIPGVPLNYTFMPDAIYNLDPQYQKENAEYLNLTFHIDPKDDLTGGVRYGREWHHADATEDVEPGYEAVAEPSASACAALHGQYGVSYPGYCNVPTPGASIAIPGGNDEHLYTPLIYHVEFSHRFNPNLMVYALVGNSWRYAAINPILAPFTGGNPKFAPYLLPAPERMRDYEGGVKVNLLDRRLTLDVDYYFYDYSSFFFTAPDAWYIRYIGSTQQAAYGSLGTFDTPAKMDGIEANAAWNIIPGRWTATGAFAYSHGWVTANAPCNPPGITPTSSLTAALGALQAANEIVATCPGYHGATIYAPYWNFNIESEYQQPINSRLYGFVRGLVNYYTSNAFTGIPGYIQPSYYMVNLYLGVHPHDGRWEVSVYAKNLTNNRTITSNGVTATDVDGGSLPATFQPQGSGYYIATILPPREFGVAVRYAFGSD